MSVEKLARRALRRVVFWRLVGDCAALPRIVFRGIYEWFALIEKTLFYMELDAARRYRAITNVDLALALGEPARYSGVTVVAAQQRDAQFHPEPDLEDE